MSVKDSVAGTAKQLVAEIMGDGRLAQEAAHQVAGGSHAAPQAQQTRQRNEHGDEPEAAWLNENRFAALLGHAALKTWADLPRDAQERLFAAAVDDGVIATDLAEFLHDRHPRTAHPPKPRRFA